MFIDPRERNNQWTRKRYALHREILKKWREALEHKKAAAATLDAERRRDGRNWNYIDRLLYEMTMVRPDQLSKLIIRLEVAMVQKPWYVKKPSINLCTSKKPIISFSIAKKTSPARARTRPERSRPVKHTRDPSGIPCWYVCRPSRVLI
jgi:hypothetical protein